MYFVCIRAEILVVNSGSFVGSTNRAIPSNVLFTHAASNSGIIAYILDLVCALSMFRDYIIPLVVFYKPNFYSMLLARIPSRGN